MGGTYEGGFDARSGVHRKRAEEKFLDENLRDATEMSKKLKVVTLGDIHIKQQAKLREILGKKEEGKLSDRVNKVTVHDLGERRQFTADQIVNLHEINNMHGIDLENYAKRPAIVVTRTDGSLNTLARTNPIRLPEENCILFEERNATCKISTIVRRFRITKEINTLSNYEQSRHNGIAFMVGDILEERFDMPNVFINVSKLERLPSLRRDIAQIKLSEINHQQLYVEKHYRLRDERGQRRNEMTLIDNPAFGAFELMDDIDTKESEYFQKFAKKAYSAYKKKKKQLASITEELTNLRSILDITEDED